MLKAGIVLRALMLGAMLMLTGSAAFAGTTPPVEDDSTVDDTSGPVIPEPTAAIVMAAGLGVVALATRLRRHE